MSRHPIPATPARPPRYSLVGVAETLTTLEERVFGAGWVMDPELCGSSRGGVVKADCFGSTDPLTPNTNEDDVGDDPFVVWAADACSTMGSARRDWEGRAQRALLASQSFHIAGELATGTIRANSTPALAEASLSISASTDATEALAKVEDEIGTSNRGERAMVHMPFSVLTLLVAQGAVRRDGTLWVTPSDNVVVADAGYGSTIPGLIVATSMISIGLSPIEIIPGTFEEAAAQMIDRSINLVELYVHRSVVLVWDQCLAFSAEVPELAGS